MNQEETKKYIKVWELRAEEYANAGNLQGFKDASRKVDSLYKMLLGEQGSGK